MQYSPRNITIACNHRGLTHFGGIYFFHEFLRVLQIRNFLARNVRYPRRNKRHSLSQMILALVYPLVLGLDRLETASFLRFNGTFQYLTIGGAEKKGPFGSQKRASGVVTAWPPAGAAAQHAPSRCCLRLDSSRRGWPSRRGKICL